MVFHDDTDAILGREMIQTIQEEVRLIHRQLEESRGKSQELDQTLSNFKEFCKEVTINFEHQKVTVEEQKAAYYYLNKF